MVGSWAGTPLAFAAIEIRVPDLRRVEHQHLAHLGTGDAQVVEVVHHRAAADDRHRLGVLEGVAVELRIGGGELDLHLRPVGVHLLGDDERQRGHRALAHLGAGAEDRHRAVEGDLHPGGHAERSFR
jgi:hypothetical protein